MLFLRNLFIAFLVCCTSFIFSQTTFPKLDANMSPPSERDITADKSQWKDVIEKRTIYSSTFITPDNRTIIHYSKQPLNYLVNGILTPIQTSPVSSSDGLTAANQPYAVSVKNNGAVEIETGNGNKITYSKNSKINNTTVSLSSLKQNGDVAVMENIIPGVDKTFEFKFNSVEYNYVIKAPIITRGMFFTIEEIIETPANSTIQGDPNFGEGNISTGWTGSLSITNNKTEIGRIKGAVCFDANKKICHAAYKIINRNGEQILQMIIPTAWINHPSRVYPITIDPLVTGPTTIWGGSYIPSCLTPGFSSDSILVTIPAQVSVTGLFVSGSYYANPFTPALMSDGKMWFSTSCNSSTTFTVAPPTGSTPGTGYLSNFDLKNPLLCCIPQSCGIQTFWLSTHIQRAVLGAGCDLTYIYHDPFSGYPFEAYVEGHTVETYGPGWNVTPNSICSDVCNVLGTVYIKYGVPPYTITHPWATTPGPVVAGVPAGCSFGTLNKQIPLTIPGCPFLCDTITVLSIPPPTVTDACGNVISTGLVAKVIHIKEKPVVTATPNPTTACSTVPYSITINSCQPGSTFSWSGNGTSGTGTTINDVVTNTGSASSTTTYTVSAVANGCTSDTVSIVVNTDPTPAAAFTSSTPIIINTPATFTDNTNAFGATLNYWNWTFGDGNNIAIQNTSHTYAVPGVYLVCLNVQTTDGCLDTVCTDVNVIPATLILPNIITPNGDGQNDYLYFKYLEYFGANTLKVYDRWGKMVYEKANYTNDWNAKNISDGTYYYVLQTADGKSYPGYFEVVQGR